MGGPISLTLALFLGIVVVYSAGMATERRRWKYRDPPWFQIVWLYLGALIFLTAFGPTPGPLVGGICLAVMATVLMAVKVIRARNQKPETDTK